MSALAVRPQDPMPVIKITEGILAEESFAWLYEKVFSQSFLEDVAQGEIKEFLDIRRQLLTIMFSSNFEVEEAIVGLLTHLMKIDPITKESVNGFEEIIKKLSAAFHGAKKSEVASLYSCSIDCLLAHLKKGTLKNLDFFRSIVPHQGNGQNKEKLEVRYVHQWEETISNGDSRDIAEKLGGLFSRVLEDQPLLFPHTEWHEAVHVVRHFGAELTSYSTFQPDSSALAIKKIQRVLVKSKEPSLSLLVSAARIYEEVISWQGGERFSIPCQLALSTDQRTPGLMALLSLSFKMKGVERVILEAELVEIFRRCIEEITWDDSKVLELFNEGLLLTFEEMESWPIKKKLFQVIKNNPHWKKKIEDLWEEKKAKWIAWAQEEKQKLVSYPEDKEAQLKLQSLQKEIDRYTSMTLAKAVEAVFQYDEHKKVKKAREVEQTLEEALTENSSDYDLFGELLEDPVILPSGSICNRKAITRWIKSNQTDPITGDPLNLEDLKEDEELRREILERKELLHLSTFRSFKPVGHPVHAQLFHAVQSLDFIGIKEALRQGGHPTLYTDEEGNTTLHIASNGDEKITQSLLLLFKSGPSLIQALKVENNAGETPILLDLHKNKIYSTLLFHTSGQAEAKACFDDLLDSNKGATAKETVREAEKLADSDIDIEEMRIDDVRIPRVEVAIAGALGSTAEQGAQQPVQIAQQTARQAVRQVAKLAIQIAKQTVQRVAPQTSRRAAQLAVQQAAEQAIEIAQQAARRAVQEVARQTSRRAIQQAAEQTVDSTHHLSRQAIQQVVQQAVQEVSQQALEVTQQTARRVVQRASRGVVGHGIVGTRVNRRASQQLAQQAVQIAQDVTRQAVQQVSQLAMEIAQQTVQRVAPQTSRRAAQQAAQQAAEQAVEIAQQAARRAVQEVARQAGRRVIEATQPPPQISRPAIQQAVHHAIQQVSRQIVQVTKQTARQAVQGAARQNAKPIVQLSSRGAISHCLIGGVRADRIFTPTLTLRLRTNGAVRQGLRSIVRVNRTARQGLRPIVRANRTASS